MFGDVDVTKPSDAIIVSVNKLSTVVLRSAVALMSPSGLILTTDAVTILSLYRSRAQLVYLI